MKHLAIFFALTLMVSCSMQKRRYQKGFYIARKHAVQKEISPQEAAGAIRQVQAPVQTAKIPAIPQDEALVAAAHSEQMHPAPQQRSALLLKKDEICDVLLFRDGKEQKGRILEITENEIKYKKCDMPDGPLYVIRKSELAMVTYANGTREVFKSEPIRPAAANTTDINYAEAKRLHNKAVWSLVLGILGLIPGSIFSVAASVAAITMGNTVMQQAQGNPYAQRDASMAKTGRLLGIIGLFITAALVITAVVLLLAYGI